MTDFKKFSDYLSNKRGIMEKIIEETYLKTRSTFINFLLINMILTLFMYFFKSLRFCWWTICI